MITSHEKITVYDLPLFSKVTLETPIDGALPLPAEACYVYILDGNGQTLSRSEDVVLAPGQMILSLCGLTAGKELAEQAEGSVSSIIVHFGHELLQRVFEGTKPELWEELETPVTRYIVQSAAHDLVMNYFEGIERLFKNQAAVTDTLLKLKLREIIFLLLQTGDADIRQIIRSLFSERTFSFKETVDAHLYSASIENLAMLTNCSLSTFKRRFKAAYGTTPNAYISDRKIEKVADLLKISEDTISAIGYSCGFNSTEHLSRTFKKKFGVSPSTYRMNLKIK
ncbi:MAG: helix-turn-helix transcriptional regulator [Pricia sp.]